MGTISRNNPHNPSDHEIGAIKKDWRNRIRVVLVYPNQYQVGIANLGFQTVYHLLNSMETVLCERAFLPRPGRGPQRPPASLESQRALKEFDLIAFAVSFEHDYLNILRILQQSHLPLKSDDRDEEQPLILAGGVACQLNPEPLAPFIDLFLIGEAEVVLAPFMEACHRYPDKQARLRQAARHVPGAYVPAFYTPQYEQDGTLAAFTPQPGIPPKVRRAYQADLSRCPTMSTLITPHSPFASPFLVEVSRGCPHGCRFCSAGYIYRPTRFRPLAMLEHCLEQGAAQAARIGLVGAAVSDLPGLDQLCQKAQASGIQLAFSSLRADALSPQLAAALAASGVKTATLAPDGGSERLRKVINKGITAGDILAATQLLVAHGIPNLKLYFMIGLPTETPADIDELMDLTLKVKAQFLQASQPRGRMGTITVSISCFVPKPFTPFQWAAMDGVTELKAKLKRIKGRLGPVANLKVHSDTPRKAWVQGLLARGDRRVAELLSLALTCDGNWSQAFKSTPLKPTLYNSRQRPADERFPWDFIDHGVAKRFLHREYSRALNGQPRGT